MMSTRRKLAKSGTPSRTTLPLALTKQISANVEEVMSLWRKRSGNGNSPRLFTDIIYGAVRQGARWFDFAAPSHTLRCASCVVRDGNALAAQVFRHYFLHRLSSGAFELIHLIVELLEIEGGLVAARQLVPAKNQAGRAVRQGARRG